VDIAEIAWDQVSKYLPSAVGRHFVAHGETIDDHQNVFRVIAFPNQILVRANQSGVS
jgi:hypothetical protein